MAQLSRKTTWNRALEDDRAQALASELRKELPPTHVLENLSVHAEAVCDQDADWVVFKLEDGRVAAVHLTWHKETDPTWPYTMLYPSFEELVRDPDWE